MQQQTSQYEQFISSGSFSSEIVTEAMGESTVISLRYQDPEDPQHNIIAELAPNYGSNLFRYCVGQHNLIYCAEDLLKKGDFTGNLVLWPLPNRIGDKRYTYCDQAYSLTHISRPGGSATLIHGLVYDRSWQYESPVVSENQVSVTTFVETNRSSPYFEAYPFPGRLTLTYVLCKNGISITYQVQNTGTKTLPFGFGLHPYFSFLSDPYDTYLSLPAYTIMEHNQKRLPTGKILNVTEPMYNPYDLRQPVPVGHLKLDHVYTDIQHEKCTIIEYRKHSLQLHIAATDDFTHVVVYTPASTPFFCVEHQTCSTNAINLHQQAGGKRLAHLLEVAPGQVHMGTLRYMLKFVPSS